MEKLGIKAQSNGLVGDKEVYMDQTTGKPIVAIDPKYYRPAEVDLLIGDASKAKRVLGWEPTVDLNGLIDLMVADDLETFKAR